MNNEEYLREIVREAVEDVLYEFKSDIAFSNARRNYYDKEKSAWGHRENNRTTSGEYERRSQELDKKDPDTQVRRASDLANRNRRNQIATDRLNNRWYTTRKAYGRDAIY
jgi:hypothetical protein